MQDASSLFKSRRRSLSLVLAFDNGEGRTMGSPEDVPGSAMRPKPSLRGERQPLEPGVDIGPEPNEWDGRCPECGGDAALTSYIGTDDMRSEEHWWCEKCMLGLKIRVVRLVTRATSARRDER